MFVNEGENNVNLEKFNYIDMLKKKSIYIIRNHFYKYLLFAKNITFIHLRYFSSLAYLYNQNSLD